MIRLILIRRQSRRQCSTYDAPCERPVTAGSVQPVAVWKSISACDHVRANLQRRIREIRQSNRNVGACHSYRVTFVNLTVQIHRVQGDAIRMQRPRPVAHIQHRNPVCIGALRGGNVCWNTSQQIRRHLDIRDRESSRNNCLIIVKVKMIGWINRMKQICWANEIRWIVYRTVNHIRIIDANNNIRIVGAGYNVGIERAVFIRIIQTDPIVGVRRIKAVDENRPAIKSYVLFATNPP